MDSKATVFGKGELLGEILVRSGRVTRSQLAAALALKQKDGLLIGQALVELGVITEPELSAALQQQGRMLCLNLSPGIIDEEQARRLEEKTSRRLCAVVLNRIAGISTVAMEDPTDLASVDEIAMLLKTRVLPVHAESGKISGCLDRLWNTGGNAESCESLERIADTLRAEGAAFAEPVVDEEGAAEAQLDQPAVNLVRGLVQDAREAGASDIHLEPRRDRFVARFRVDGVLVDRLTLAKTWAHPCLARIKALAGLDPTSSRSPQAGNARAEINGRPVDLRIATTPTLFGECAVVSLLDDGRLIHDLEALELDQNRTTTLRRMIESGDGLVLAAGPTGSGKTTTLYAILQELNRPGRKVVTLEDPVQDRVEGVTQIQVDDAAGLTFARGLRSLLRQDPDVLLVGEIRDEETARIAVQAGLAGRVVLSTLDTADTVETISRLTRMGIEPYLLADALSGVLAQRLLRRVCTDCRRPLAADPDLLRRLRLDDQEITPYEGAGCRACRNTGFRGRVPVCEVLLMTPDLRSMVRSGHGSDEIRQAAVAAGLVTLREDAIRKVRAGVTTLTEALAATSRGYPA